MSYDLTFFKERRSTIDAQYDFLEGSGLKKTDSFTKSEQDVLTKQLMNLHPNSSVIKSKNSTEITLPYCQIGLYKTQIGLSIPYGEVPQIGSQSLSFYIKLIIQIIVDLGYDGFDNQSEEFISDITYDFKQMFEQINDMFEPKNKPVLPNALEEILRDKVKATQFWFKERDRILSLVPILQEKYTNYTLDFSPKSLKTLEGIYYNYLEKKAFDEEVTKMKFETLLAVYKANVYVLHRHFSWEIHKDYTHQIHLLAVESSNKAHRIVISRRANFEKFPDKQQETLYKEYQRMV